MGGEIEMQKSNIKNQKLDVPYYSQRTDVEDCEWRDRSCGIVNAKMVLEFYGIEIPISDLIKEGLCIGGHSKEYGWKHSALAAILRNHGINAYAQEFRSHEIDPGECVGKESIDEASFVSGGIKKIKEEIFLGRPVIVSVLPEFAANKVHHTVVITGFKEDEKRILGLYYNDPGAKDQADGEFQFSTLERFVDHWKKFAIFTYPQT